MVVSDQGKQLTSSSNTAAFNAKESPDAWNWEEMKESGARAGTTWEFVPAGCQFRNGLAEARVRAIKRTVSHMLASTVNGEKPTLNYAELGTLLAKAANVVNDRPIGVKSLTEDELVPITVNQLLLGRTSSSPPPDHEMPGENYRAAKTHLDSLTQMWWNLWMEQGFPTLLPYYKYKDTKRHQNLRVNNICLIKYETKVASTYRLCRMSKLLHSDDGLVRTVEVRQGNKKPTKKNQPGKVLVTAVQRLMLLVPADELQQGPP